MKIDNTPSKDLVIKISLVGDSGPYTSEINGSSALVQLCTVTCSGQSSFTFSV